MAIWSKMVRAFLNKFSLFIYQSEEEASLAIEYLASKKVDTYTVSKSSQQWLLFFSSGKSNS